MGPTTRIPVKLIAILLVLTPSNYFANGQLGGVNIQVSDENVGPASSHLILARTAEDDGLDLIAEESSSNVATTSHPDQEARYKVPYAYAFNGGKPFSLEKDPITGKIDLEKTPPLKALNLTEIYREDEEDDSDDSKDDTARIDQDYYSRVGFVDSKRVSPTNSKNERVGPNEITPYTPEFHDFLNLPVRYSSEKYEKDKYPLISSSYANTKVQSGSNSYNIYNHRVSDEEIESKIPIVTASRKTPSPRTTTVPSTSTSTMEPATSPSPKTTTTTTTTTTTMKPIEKKTSTPKPTKAPTTPTTTTTTTTTTSTTTTTTTTTPRPTKAPTTTSTSARPQPTIPKITTWKPSKGDGYDDYEEMLPIEKLQTTKQDTKTKPGQYPSSTMDLNGHNNGPQSPSKVYPSPTYDYNEGYEDYESLSEEQPQSDQQHPTRVDIVQSVDLTELNKTTPAITTEKPMKSDSTTVSTTTAAPSTQASTPMRYQPQNPLQSILLTTSKPPVPSLHQQPPAVTSMPLDSGPSPPLHENFVESHRPVQMFGGNANVPVQTSMHFGGGNMYTRPGSVISVLPESTSNVIVPHDQDTVSFVLGNRQNVEGSYYTHDSPSGDNQYVSRPSDNSFRPFFGSGPNVKQTMVDQTLSVAMPSVAVVEPSSSSHYNPQQWYNSESVKQGAVKPVIVDAQTNSPTRSTAPVTFPGPEISDEQNDTPINQNKEQAGSNFGTLPERDGGEQSVLQQHQHQQQQQQHQLHQSHQQIPNQRPVEEHVIVINQADASIKEITQNGPINNPSIENSVPLNVNHNGPSNIPNLPQLSDDLTPPAEGPPPGGRPMLGGPLGEPLGRPHGGPPPYDQRPPQYFHYHHGNNGGVKPLEFNGPRPQRLPMPPRQKPDLPPVGFKRRPGPTHDVKLPNILPQFRPNAKTSYGHRDSEKIGTIPAPQGANFHHNHPHPPGQPHPPSSQHLRPQPPRRTGPPQPIINRLSPPLHTAPGHHYQPVILHKKDDILPPSSSSSSSGPHDQRYPRPPIQPPQQQQQPPRLNSPLQQQQHHHHHQSQQAHQSHPQHQQRILPAQKLRMDDELSVDRFSPDPPPLPPRPVIYPNSRSDGQMPKIATLQMIQHHSSLDEVRSNLSKLGKDNGGQSEDGDNKDNATMSNEPADRRKDSNGEHDDSGDKQDAQSETGPVYVVYPVNSAVNIGSGEDGAERDESVVVGTRGSQRPLPPDTLPHDDEEAAGATNDDSKLPSYLYGKNPQHNNVNSDFGNTQNHPVDPYELYPPVREKPLLIPSDEYEQEQEEEYYYRRPITPARPIITEAPTTTTTQAPESSFSVISYLTDLLPFGSSKPKTPPPPPQPSPPSLSDTISARLPLSSPIAFAYTPTTPREEPLLKPRDERPILLPHQQPSSSSSSAPSPQSFMAPFVASAEAPSQSSGNGWSVVAPSQPRINGTERNSSDNEVLESNQNQNQTQSLSSSHQNSQSSQTERNEASEGSFDPESFKPVLFGGFQPIYEFPVDDEDGSRPKAPKSETLGVNADSGRGLR